MTAPTRNATATNPTSITTANAGALSTITLSASDVGSLVVVGVADAAGTASVSLTVSNCTLESNVSTFNNTGAGGKIYDSIVDDATNNLHIRIWSILIATVSGSGTLSMAVNGPTTPNRFAYTVMTPPAGSTFSAGAARVDDAQGAAFGAGTAASLNLHGSTGSAYVGSAAVVMAVFRATTSIQTFDMNGDGTFESTSSTNGLKPAGGNAGELLNGVSGLFDFCDAYFDTTGTGTKVASNTTTSNKVAASVIYKTTLIPITGYQPPPRPPGRVAPSGVGFTPFTHTVGDRQQGTPQGIASTAAFGAPTVVSGVFARPTGIDSTNAFGTVSVSTALPLQHFLQLRRPPGKVSPGGVGFAPIARPRDNVIGLPPGGIASTNAFGTPAFYGLDHYEVLLDPITADAVSITLLVSAASRFAADVGDVRIALHQGSTELVTSAFTALSNTLTVFKLTVDPTLITVPTDLRAYVEFRALTTNVLGEVLADIALDYTHDIRVAQRKRPPGRVSPAGVGFAPMPRPAREPQYPAITGIGPTESVGVPTGSTAQVVVPVFTHLRRPIPPGKVAPGGAGFAPLTRPATFSTAHVTPAGLGPTERIGVPTGSSVTAVVTASPTGIASTNAFGVPTLGSHLATHLGPTGIPTHSLVGVPTGSSVVSSLADGEPVFRWRRPPGKVSPGGLGFIRTYQGNFAISRRVSPAGIPPTGTYTGQATGTYTNQAGTPYTVEQYPAIGHPAVSLRATGQPTGIASTNAFGTPTLQVAFRAHPVGIASGTGFGVPTVAAAGQVVIRPVGIVSTNAFGVPGSQGVIPGLVGIASVNAFGAPRVTTAGGTTIWNVREPFPRWGIGYPHSRWETRDPATAT